MRTVALALVVLATFLVPVSALADTMDHISIVGDGLDIEFAEPASTTAPDFEFYSSFGFPPVPGTVNDVPASIGLTLIFPCCAVGSTIQLVTGSQFFFLGLPLDLYQLIPNPGTTETLNLVPGSYDVSSGVFPTYGPEFNITITPEATAATPELSTLSLVGSAALLSLGALRRRLRRLSVRHLHSSEQAPTPAPSE